MGTIALRTLIAHVESNDDQYAQRFENGLHERRYARLDDAVIDAVKKANKCSQATAMALCCFSFGAYQIMGFNLYGPKIGYAGSTGKFFADRAAQDDVFDRFIGLANVPPKVFADDMDDRDLRDFAIFYNGPGKPDEYVKRLKAVMTHMKGGIT